ncbi:antagonist of [Yamadazyma tenuis ATCC 10573]|uniref:Antagonist of n=3 Tax=Candida tenuis TaxID=2315449 RepID=G3AZ60_CANTC|nr:antagonist of [Yamadazyma tenuis ATCC 10573]EGV66015.1 antagonist of [Yamadazyma tenuis ATCC 10573]
MDDNNTPLSSPNPLTPKNCFLEQAGKFFDDYKPKKLRLVEEWSPRTPSIFDIPEIVHKILDYAAIQNDNSPQELAPLRRKPLSYNHALLIHGNKRLAEESMKIDTSKDYNCTNVLYNCLFVNKLFNSVANEILGKRFYFEDGHKLKTFVQNVPKSVNFKPTDFKLYKMFHLTNECLQPVLYSLQFQNLQTIEVFMCPRFLPTPEMFEYGQNIKKIVICGSKCLDDDYLIMISTKCPNLEVLDIRGCELVTDSGIYHIGKNCHKLTSINLGRKSKGHLITDAGVSTLVKNNVNLDTVGLAGCHITDKTLWDLTTYCNYSIQRISVNSCPLVTNQSIPLILHANYLPLLNVLEIRFTKVDNLKPIIEFKRRQEFNGVSILIEMCEALSFKMRQQELELDKSISERIFNDIQDWANDSDDGDTSYLTLLSSRSSGRSSRVTSSTS